MLIVKKILFIFTLLIIPAIVSAMNDRYDIMAGFLAILGIILFLEKRRDIVDKYF